MESHGRINFGPHSSSLSPAGSSGRFESVIKGYSRTLCQIMEAEASVLSCTAHSDPSSVRQGPGPCIPPRCPTAGTSVVPMVPLVRYLGAGKESCPAVSLAPKDHLTRLCDSVRPASSQVQGHPPHSSEGSQCPCLVRGITVLLAKDVMVPVPPANMKAGFFSHYFIVPKKCGGLRPILGMRILNWAFHKPPF